MAKYRPVDTRMWSDRKFLSLGDDARLLWAFLLTGPFALPIPGVIVAGPAAIAERLGWSAERLAKRFAEVQRSGLSVSQEGTLVWLHNATKYQPPANPNVVIGWSKVWDDVPEGLLKVEIWQALKIACKSWSRIFEKRFREPLSEPFMDCSDNRYTQEQEQDQEQEQEQKQEQDQVALAPTAARNLHQPAVEAFDRYFKNANAGAAPSWDGKRIKMLKAKCQSLSVGEVVRRIEILESAPPPWPPQPWDLPTFVQHIDKLAAPSRGNQTGFDAVLALANGDAT